MSQHHEPVPKNPGCEDCENRGSLASPPDDRVSFALQCFGNFFTRGDRAKEVLPTEEIEAAISCILKLLSIRIQLAERAARDWRLGLAVTPKLRTHSHYRQIGVVRRINPPTARDPETIYVELYDPEGPVIISEDSDHWKTM